MIGLKSACALAVAAILVALGALRGVLDSDHLAHLGAAACFLIGLVASLATGLVAAGWRPELPSRTALARRGVRLVILDDATPRELPATLQRVLLLAGFASVALVAISNHAAAKLTQLPAELATPSPSKFCIPDVPAEHAAPAPPPAPVDRTAPPFGAAAGPAEVPAGD